MSRAVYISFVFALIASSLLHIFPLPGGGPSETILAIPVVLAALPILWRHRMAGGLSVTLLGAFALVTGFSIGVFYAPAIIAMGVAVDRQTLMPRQREAHE
jgi:hypothetical protein